MNRTPIVAALLAALVLSACSHRPPAPPPSAAAEPVCMQLQVSRLKPGQGPLMAAAYGSADSFLKQPVWVNRAQADTAQVTVAVCGVDSADIAFTVFQDLNGNGKLDMNPMGIPTEPYGFSGRPVFGPPSWDNAKTAAGAGRVVHIEL
jgi:uncharacterized protein (DUF2141 family)